MDDFPFTFNLNYKIEDYIIKPPSSLFKLKEIASEKYDINIERLSYILKDEETEKNLKTEQDYAELIDYASEQELTEVLIEINKPNVESSENENSSGSNNNQNSNRNDEIENECEYDYYGDTRNRKGFSEEGYNKHNKGFKEQKRIKYIIEKKEMQRQETLKANKNKNKNKKKK